MNFFAYISTKLSCSELHSVWHNSCVWVKLNLNSMSACKDCLSKLGIGIVVILVLYDGDHSLIWISAMHDAQSYFYTCMKDHKCQTLRFLEEAYCKMQDRRDHLQLMHAFRLKRNSIRPSTSRLEEKHDGTEKGLVQAY